MRCIGEKGDEGYFGFQGAPGPQGQKGDTGFYGAAGQPGDFGPQGEAGLDGRPGNTRYFNKIVILIK